MGKELILALDEVEKTKGVPKEVLLEALEKALERSYEKNYPGHSNVEVDLDRESGDIYVYSLKEVVENVEDPQDEMSLEEARSLTSMAELGDLVRVVEKPKNFDRIAAQAAKNIILQKIRDAERQAIYDEYIHKEHELIVGTVQRADFANAMINLGKAEGIIPHKEMIPRERLHPGDRVKLYVLEVRNSQRGAQIVLSRAHPKFVARLFEEEVPELAEGLVEIHSIARQAGSRSKIAVFANDPEIDPIGAFVGYKGSRVNAVVDELNGEKMDIVTYDPEITKFITNALSPSDIIKVIPEEEGKMATVIVPDDQLSLAIGRGGQNVQLAARLTGWKIDIKGESEYAEEDEETVDLFSMDALEEVRKREEKGENPEDLEDGDEETEDLEEEPAEDLEEAGEDQEIDQDQGDDQDLAGQGQEEDLAEEEDPAQEEDIDLTEDAGDGSGLEEEEEMVEEAGPGEDGDA